MIDVLNTPLWESKVPHVQEMLLEMYKEAIKARGEAFSFRLRMHTSVVRYKYTSRLFASPEWRVMDIYYHEKDMSAEFREAAECLREYMEDT